MDNLSNSINKLSDSHSYLKQRNIDNLHWFDLSYYDGLSALDRTSIHNIINFRRHVLETIEVDSVNKYSIFCLCIIDTYEIANNKKKSFLNLPKISQYSFANLSEIIKYTKKTCNPDYYEDDKSHKKDLEIIFKAFAGEIIRVNLTDNDDALIKSFKNWLKEKRAEENQNALNTKQVSDNIFSKIKQYKIIPYIDLLLWSKVIQQKLTYKEIAQLLYPDDIYKDAEYIRKTIHPLATNILYASVNKI